MATADAKVACCTALSHCLSSITPQMDFRIWDGGDALSKICALSGLEEATLGLRCEGARGLHNWAPPAPGLSSLRSLALDS